MSFEENVRVVLIEEFAKAQARNSRFSMRAYSKKIGISQSAISEIFSGRRKITKKSAEKILTGLGKDPSEIAVLLNPIDETRIEAAYTPVDIDAFHMISDWYYYAILSLLDTKDFESSPAWIAERLGLKEKVVEEALERLIRLEMIQRSKTGALKHSGQNFEAISSIANPALKKANRQNLELAEAALDSVPVELRDFTAMTLCFDPDRIDDARKMIKTFRRNFDRVMEAGHKKEVYKLCIQLFPLSHRLDGRKSV